jgi:hypothetical protein
MGVAGFVVSLVGLVLTCCVLCPLGLIFSLIGLGRRPRGLAIAGTVIGGLGTLLLVVAVAVVVGRGPEKVVTDLAIFGASLEIKAYKDQHGELPDDEEGERLLGDMADGWERPLRYRRDGGTFEIVSAGPDGEFDTADDLKK